METTTRNWIALLTLATVIGCGGRVDVHDNHEDAGEPRADVSVVETLDMGTDDTPDMATGMDRVQGVLESIYPNMTVDDVLRLTATEAQLGPDEVDAVVASTGTLRRSWMLRNSAAGFVIEEPVVRSECIDDTRAWCFGTGWDTTSLYAPTKTAALGSIDDLRELFGQLAP